MNNNIKPFLDPIGRIIVGTVLSETEDELNVQSPAVVHIQPNPQNQQLQLQILPLIFRELLATNSQSPTFSYKKKNITPISEANFAPQFYAQYASVIQASTPSQVSSEDPQSNVVELFDKEGAD